MRIKFVMNIPNGILFHEDARCQGIQAISDLSQGLDLT